MTENTTRVGSAPGRSVRKVFLLSLGALVLLAAAAYALWWWKFRDTLHYVTARVSRGDIRRSINMTGALNPVVTAQVGSFVSGNIKSWSCDYNTQVKVGQQCALIDPLPFQVVVDETDADVRTSKAQLVKDRAAAANARIVYERDKKLRDQGIVSQETLDADKSTLDQDVATIDLDVANIASKEAALHAAKVNLGYTNIVSPVNGTVITRYIDVGYTVVSNLQSSTLFLIGKDMSSMQVDTNVSEADVGEVHDGQKASFTVQAYPNRTFEATVRQVRKGPITVQNVVTYDVVLDVPNKDLALLPGMTSDTHIITAERKNVLRVPLPATRFVPDGLGRVGRAGAGGGDGAGRGAGGGSGGGAGGGEVAQNGSDMAGVAGPGGTDDGLSGSTAQGADAGTHSQGDDNQQRHRRWNRDQGAAGAAGGSGATGSAGVTGAAGGSGVTGSAGSTAGRGAGASGAGGAGAARRGRGPRAMARLWVLRNGVLTPIVVRTGLDDGTLVEIYTEDLKEGDEVVVNAVRPNAPRPAAGERSAAGGQGGPNGARGGGGAGGGFRL
jgi:HlyD family secretion protein